MAKKRALGRGLDALIRVESEVVSSLPLNRLRPNRLQPREVFDEEALAELARSIEAQGVIQPLVVAPSGGDYVIVAGERRWRAARLAGLESVPVVVRDANDEQQLEMALVENLQRADLNALEEAEAYSQLQKRFGLSQEEVAKRVGKSRAAVANTTRLLKLPPEVQDLVRGGALKAGQARPLLAIADAEEQLRLARRAAAGELSSRQLEARAAGRKQKKKRLARVLDADTAAAAERLTRVLQTKVEIRRKGRGGAVAIHFHSEEELMRLYELLTKAGSTR